MSQLLQEPRSGDVGWRLNHDSLPEIQKIRRNAADKLTVAILETLEQEASVERYGKRRLSERWI